MRLKAHYDELRHVDEGHRRELMLIAAAIFVWAWAEVQRRLGVLNHAHEQAQERDKTFVSIEKFDAQVEAEDTSKRVVAKALDLAEGRRLGVGQVIAIVTGAVAFLAGVVLVANGAFG
jgi:hypothetical protein